MTCGICDKFSCCRHWPNIRISLVSMEQSPIWEANKFLASQENPRVLWNNPKFHHRIHKSSPPVPILRKIKQVHARLLTFRRFILMFCYPRLGLPRSLFPSDFPPKLFAAFLSPYMLHAPPVSFLIWSPEWWLVRSTEHKVPLNLSSNII